MDINFNKVELSLGDTVGFENFPSLPPEFKMTVAQKRSDKYRFAPIRYWDIKNEPMKYEAI